MGFQSIQKEASGSFTISAAGPVLIADGSSSKLNPELTDNRFLSGTDASGNRVYVIPGSSIKGVIRHYLYNYMNDTQINELFGYAGKNGKYKSKISFSDAYADMETVETILRTNTRIGSVSQGANKGLNDALAVNKGDFHCSFRMCNYSTEELKWILSALNGFHTGEICIGGRVSRGFGRVRVSDFHMIVAAGYTKELKPRVIGEYVSLEAAMTAVISETENRNKCGGVVYAGV